VFLSFVAAIAFATIPGGRRRPDDRGERRVRARHLGHGRETQREDEREQVLVARVTAAEHRLLSIVLAIALRSLNVAFSSAFAFAVRGERERAGDPAVAYWRRFNTAGMITGMIVGLVSALVLIILGPSVMGVDAAGVAARHLIQRPPLFPLDNPAIVSVPLGFLGALLGTLAGARSPTPTPRIASSTCAPTQGWARSNNRDRKA
jgi:cation/acetate symporter